PGPLYHLSHGQREPEGPESKEGSGNQPAPLDHLSHGQRDRLVLRSLSLPEQNALLLGTSRANSIFSPAGSVELDINSLLDKHFRRGTREEDGSRCSPPRRPTAQFACFGCSEVVRWTRRVANVGCAGRVCGRGDPGGGERLERMGPVGRRRSKAPV